MANAPTIATAAKPNADLTADGQGGYSMTSDAQPYWDDCSTRDAVAMSGTNIGDELNAAGVSWGWFEGGFRPTTTFATPRAAGTPASRPRPSSLTSSRTPDSRRRCRTRPTKVSATPSTRSAAAVGGTGQYGYKDDYIPHHEPFQYYASTANPHHLTPPTDANGNDTPAALGRSAPTPSTTRRGRHSSTRRTTSTT